MSWHLDLVTIRLRVPKYGWTEMCTEHLQLSSYKTAANPPVITMAMIKNVPVGLKSFTHNIFSSVTRSCSTLRDSMDCSTPGFPVHHQFSELAQTHPSSQWCYPTISFSVVPFSSCPQSFSASGFFPMSQLFASGGQSIGASSSASVLPMNIQDWFPLGLTG